MDRLTVKVVSISLERLMESKNLDDPEDVLFSLDYVHTDVTVTDIENIIIDTLCEFGCSYQIRSSRRTVNWGASGSTGEIVAYIQPLIEAAVSGASYALVHTLFQRLREKKSSSTESNSVGQSQAIGLDASEVKARDYIRSRFGQEKAITLIRGVQSGNAGYTFEFECDNVRVEVLTSLDGYVFGSRRIEDRNRQ